MLRSYDTPYGCSQYFTGDLGNVQYVIAKTPVDVKKA
jgi:hypothetical protein